MLPDAVLPRQFFAKTRGALAQRGEFQLLRAVLQDAIECFRVHALAHDRRGQRLFREAQQWIMGNGYKPASSDAPVLLSFEYICEVFGIDASAVRRALHQWHEEQCLADGRQL